MNVLKKALTVLAVIFVGALCSNTALGDSSQLETNPVNKSISETSLHVKFEDSANIVFSDGQFVSDTVDTTYLNKVIKSEQPKKQKQLIDNDRTQLKNEAKQLKKRVKHVVDLGNYYQIDLSKPTSKKLADELSKLPFVSEAYAKQLPAPAPVSPNYVTWQNYLKPQPDGMNVTAAKAFPGALGNKVKIADLEYNWNNQHEDLKDARAAGVMIPNGTHVDPFSNTNHGTAVVGVLSGDQNKFGVSGIARNAKLHLVNTYNAERGWDIPNAIYAATASLGKGDVILIEQQSWGPDGSSYAPVEWVPANYDAIVNATAKGIIVVQAAGNSGMNLDDPMYGTNFPMGKPDSGSIIVGAGAACGYQPNRSRMYFSNYGSRVDIQSHGECVTSTGYGYLYSGLTQNEWYTDRFSGTSSASALIAGVAASVSSSHEMLYGTGLTSVEVRAMLQAYGTNQDTTFDSGNIGKLPNLKATLSQLDTINPTAPTNLTASLNDLNQVVLNWNAATDNSKIKTYKIFRNGKAAGSTAKRTFTDKKSLPGTTYTYTVRAVDLVGNLSPHSEPIVITTNP